MSELRGSSEADVIIDRLLLNCTRWRHHRTRHSVDGTGGLSERAAGVGRLWMDGGLGRGGGRDRVKHEGVHEGRRK